MHHRCDGDRPAAGGEFCGFAVEVDGNVIKDAKFKCMGCTVAIACSSMATEMILGKPVDEAHQISEQAVADALGGIPEYKVLCSNFAPEGIRRAIDDWRRRGGEAGGSQSSGVGRC